MSQPEQLFLVLDDEESIRQSIAAYMEDEGYVVFTAASGEEAIEIVKDQPIDAAVVDIRLPGIDGNTFMVEARRIRPDISLVVHTGSTDYTPPEEVQALGIDRERILIKPTRDLGAIIKALNG